MHQPTAALFLRRALEPAALAICLLVTSCATQPTRSFLLQFQQGAYVVPASEYWCLRWISPYQAGDICPGYDVRIEKGSAQLGVGGEIQASASDGLTDPAASLDLSATRGRAVVWLEPGAVFSIANALLQIEVDVYAHQR